MNWVYDEICHYKKVAEKKGMDFSIRINGTSDITPILFKHNGKTLFDLFPDVQFYDYTKVLNRTKLNVKNYDLTFSYSGYNWDECMEAFLNGTRLSVVFENTLPKSYMGIPVVDADMTDLRYMDEKNVICGLKFKKVRNKINVNNQKFVVATNDINCVY
jgi:hypothetical protein